MGDFEEKTGFKAPSGADGRVKKRRRAHERLLRNVDIDYFFFVLIITKRLFLNFWLFSDGDALIFILSCDGDENFNFLAKILKFAPILTRRGRGGVLRVGGERRARPPFWFGVEKVERIC